MRRNEEGVSRLVLPSRHFDMQGCSRPDPRQRRNSSSGLRHGSALVKEASISTDTIQYKTPEGKARACSSPVFFVLPQAMFISGRFTGTSLAALVKCARGMAPGTAVPGGGRRFLRIYTRTLPGVVPVICLN